MEFTKSITDSKCLNYKTTDSNNDYFNTNANKLSIHKHIKQQLANTLEVFLLKVTKEGAKEIAWNIINQYQKNKWKSNNDLLLKMVFIYSKHQLMVHYQKFIRWSSRFSIRQKRNGIKPVRCYYSFEESMQNSKNAQTNLNIHMNANSNVKNNSLSNLSILSLNNKPITNAMTGFLNRQVQFKENQTKAIEKVLKDSEEEYALICTFNPRINSNSNNNSNTHDKLNPSSDSSKRHACLRLYDERISRQNKREQIEKNEIDKIKRVMGHNKTKVDESKIFQLYEDFKLRKNKKRLLAKQVDNDRGYTYTPDISTLNRSIKKLSSCSSSQLINSVHITQRNLTPIQYRTEKNLSIKIHNSYITNH